jgi:hypothetical protein
MKPTQTKEQNPMSTYLEWNLETFGPSGETPERHEPGDRVRWMADGREPRFSRRGKPQTSQYRADRIARESLTVRRVEPTGRLSSSAQLERVKMGY